MVKKKKNKTSGSLHNAHQLLFSSIKRGDLSGVLKAIEDGAEVEPTRMKAQYKRKKSPLLCAVQNGNVNVIRALIEAKAKIDIDCISLAYKKNNYDMVHLILSECKVTKLLGEWYFHAIDLKWGDIVELLTERKCPLDTVNDLDNTPLHHTILKGDFKGAKLLIDARADVSGVNCNEETPLHLAIKRLPTLARFLIAQKCPLDIEDNEGLQPLHLALTHNLPEVAKLLIEASCDVTSTDGKGRTPLFLVLTASWASPVHFSQVSLVKLLLKSNCAVDRSILETAIRNDATEVVWIFLESSDELTDLSGLVKLAQEYCCEVESPLRQLEVQRALEDCNVQVFPPRIASVIARWSWKIEKLDLQQAEKQVKSTIKKTSTFPRSFQRGRPGRGRYHGERNGSFNYNAGRGRNNGRIPPHIAARNRGNGRISNRGVTRGRYRSQGELRKFGQTGYRGQRNGPPSPTRGDGIAENSLQSEVTLESARKLLYNSLVGPKPPFRAVCRALRTFERVKPRAKLPDDILKVAIDGRSGSQVIRALLNAGSPLVFSAISEAVKRSRTDVLKIFLASDQFDVNMKGSDGKTLFDVARVNGRTAVTKMLEDVKK